MSPREEDRERTVSPNEDLIRDRDAQNWHDLMVAFTAVVCLVVADVVLRLVLATGIEGLALQISVGLMIFVAVWATSIAVSLRTDRAVHVDLGGELWFLSGLIATVDVWLYGADHVLDSLPLRLAVIFALNLLFARMGRGMPQI